MPSAVAELFLVRSMRVLAVCILLASCSAACGARYTDRMFRHAIRFCDGTSPPYVLFTLDDPVHHARRQICTVATGLLAAIHAEYHLGYDSAGMQQAERIALTATRHEFSFHRRDALRAVQVPYDEATLARVRSVLTGYSDSQLRRDGALSHYRLSSIYAPEAHHVLSESYRDATAHVLLERGIAVSQDDRSAVVFVDET